VRRAAAHASTPQLEGEADCVRRIIASEGITFDGYFADPQGEIAWQVLDHDFNSYSLEFLDSVDSLLFGHVTYELMKAWWPTPAGGPYPVWWTRRLAARFVGSFRNGFDTP
jgi:dihydrofolate reductase